MSESQTAFETSQYRNILKDYGYEEQAITEKLQDTWNKLFSSDYPETQIYFETESNEAYMLDTGNLDVRTEGMSYGMMMAVQMDRKDVFDRLWKWTKNHMYNTEGEYAGYFAWSCQPDGTKNHLNPAPDGEEFFALDLFFASHRWGDGEAPFNYSEQARKLLHDCIHKGENDDGDPIWNPDNKLIKFEPTKEFSDPSYHLPHFYELFALWASPEDQTFWKQAADASRAYIKLTAHPETGLAPEYAYYDGTPNDEKGYGQFFSDSYRVACNIGLDYEWFKDENCPVEVAAKIQKFFADKNPEDYRRYTIDGEPFEEKSLHPVGLIAANAMASLATTGPEAEKCVQLFWDTPVRTGDRRYYDNCLYLFSLLALSGNYKIWMPKE